MNNQFRKKSQIFLIAYIISNEEVECKLFDLFNVCSNDIDEIVDIPINYESCYFFKSKRLRPLVDLVIYLMRRMTQELC